VVITEVNVCFAQGEEV